MVSGILPSLKDLLRYCIECPKCLSGLFISHCLNMVSKTASYQIIRMVFSQNDLLCVNNCPLLKNWSGAIDSGKCVYTCFLDIAKTFDRVDLLIQKLSNIKLAYLALN